MWKFRSLRRRGFGIHSPFAYRFVVEVIGDKDGYYDYDQLSGVWQCLLYRVAVFVQPSEIIEVNGGDAAPARLACPERERKAPLWTLEDKTKLAVVGEGASASQIEQLLDQGWVVFAEGGVKSHAYLTMNFHISHGPSILFPWKHLPSGDYKV